MQATVAPIVNTSHAIRTAKILRMAAEELGENADVALYDEDIAMFTQALQAHAWDAEAGYFSYVRHDENGRPLGFLRHESGANFNMGLDGASPLVAGICTREQEKRLLEHLSNPQRMWTKIGLSTVDQSAPYYQTDGYWNGAVWMPHQWFIWKALLDLGHSDFAEKVARTGLETWKAEVDNSYNCFEHFIVQTGRGAGWHHFGGLSTPVLSWFAAYCSPGNLTGGFDVWMKSRHFNEDNTQLTANWVLSGQSDHAMSLVAAMNPKAQYRAFWNGAEAESKEFNSGILDIRLESGSGRGELRIERV